MGLAEKRKRHKIGHDPRNNQWGDNTEKLGYKLMSQMGWSPGKRLGLGSVEESSQQQPIKMIVKDDNLGIGAKSSQVDECVGLMDFHALLGRLNGNEEQAAVAIRSKQKEAAFGKYGMKFVRGETYTPTTVDDEPLVALERRPSPSPSPEDDLRCAERNDPSIEKKLREEERRKRREERARRRLERTRRREDRASRLHEGSVKKSVREDKKSSGTTYSHHLGVRAKYIAQKRAALQNESHLREILMIKA